MAIFFFKKAALRRFLVCQDATRDSRWFVFKTKLPIWVNIGGSSNVKYWYILCPFGMFCDHLVYFSPFWHIVPRKIWQPWTQLCSLLRCQFSAISKKQKLWMRQFSIEPPNRVAHTNVPLMVARWYIFKPKITIWVNFGVSCNERH
jgi:hypothetical protein